MNITLIPNRDKPDAMEAAAHLCEILEARAKANQGVGRVAVLPTGTTPQATPFKPDLIIVLGGDGTILCTAHALAGLHTPVVGINFGKLGYLAAYSIDEFIEKLDLVLSGKAPISQRLMLRGEIYPWHRSTPATIQKIAYLNTLTPRHAGVALNDVVINAGEPFRMIELEVHVDDERTTHFRSDGLVVATPSGSTGYNLSAGGPLISPEVEAMVLTPICPYTLSFRPVVLSAGATIVVFPQRLNPGSRVVFDGQVTAPISEHECLVIRRLDTCLELVENPKMTHWQMLAQKMHWARSPRI